MPRALSFCFCIDSPREFKQYFLCREYSQNKQEFMPRYNLDFRGFPLNRDDQSQKPDWELKRYVDNIFSVFHGARRHLTWKLSRTSQTDSAKDIFWLGVH